MHKDDTASTGNDLLARGRNSSRARWVGQAATAMMLCASPLTAGITMKEFMDNRVERFGALKAADPDQPARIEAAKARTVQMMAAAGPVGAVDALPVVWRANERPIVIFEDPVAPRMVVVPAGEFTMKSGGAPRRVRLAKPLAVAMFPVVVGEFAAFVADTGYRPASSCVTLDGDRMRPMAHHDYTNPGVAATPRDPVTCVAYKDALAYAAWLSKRTGQNYRLLSGAEYEYANRAGTASKYGWGDDAGAACAYANGYDLDGQSYRGAPMPIACHDGQASVAQVGKYKSNGFGLFDTSGNVESWTSDCGDRACHTRLLYGGSWQGGELDAAYQHKADGRKATSWRGFRLVRDL